jgi:MFS family permease
MAVPFFSPGAKRGRAGKKGDKTGGLGYYYSNVRKMYIIGFLHTLMFFGGVSVPFFLDWGRMSYAQFFVLEAWFQFWCVALEVPTGVVADKVSRKLSIALSGFCIAIGALLYSLVPDFFVFMLAEFAWAAGTAFLSGADDSMIYDTLKEARKSALSKKVLSNYYAVSSLGMIVALPLGGVFVKLSMWPYPKSLVMPMLATGMAVGIAGFVALTLREPRIGRTREMDHLKHTKDSIGFLMRHKRLWALSVNWGVIASLCFFNFWFYQPLLKQSGVGVEYYGMVGAAFNAVAFVLLSRLENIEGFIGKRNFLFATALLPGIAYLALGASSALPLVLLGITIISTCWILREPAIRSEMHGYIQSRRRATVMSAASMAQKLVMVVLYPVVGALADWSLEGTLIILGIATTGSALALHASGSDLIAESKKRKMAGR